MNIRKPFLFCLSFFYLAVFTATAHAHYPWINVTNYTPGTGSSLHMTFGWGHRYPMDGFLKKDALENLSVTGPEKITLTFTSDLEIKSREKISTPGAYIVSATRKTGFYTKTAQGGKLASKVNLKDVIKCYYSHMCMKAIVNAGEGKGKVNNLIGHPIEIIPLKNPADLRIGDYMPVRVLIKNKPFSGYLYATYAGFSTRNETFAYTTRTDKKGMGKIRILKPGVWMIKATHKTGLSG